MKKTNKIWSLFRIDVLDNTAFTVKRSNTVYCIITLFLSCLIMHNIYADSSEITFFKIFVTLTFLCILILSFTINYNSYYNLLPLAKRQKVLSILLSIVRNIVTICSIVFAIFISVIILAVIFSKNSENSSSYKPKSTNDIVFTILIFSLICIALFASIFIRSLKKRYLATLFGLCPIMVLAICNTNDLLLLISVIMILIYLVSSYIIIIKKNLSF